jgi:uridylate kinase
MVTVISLGGSIVAPGGVDVAFLRSFTRTIGGLIREDDSRSFILVVGGGGPARAWQSAYRDACDEGYAPEEADWIGVMATRLNAQLVKAIFAAWCKQDVVTDPSRADAMTGKVLVAAGWKPGFSSDYDAVVLAERFNAQTVINLSNIEKVYTADPKVDPSARPLDRISWEDFRAMVGDEWVPGKNVPFDPVASRHAQKIGVRVICAAGNDLANLEKIIRGGDFTGTTIG